MTAEMEIVFTELLVFGRTKCSVAHRSLIKQLVCTYSLSQKEGFSFESIINAGSFSLITTEKQGICGCLITSMYHDNI